MIPRRNPAASLRRGPGGPRRLAALVGLLPLLLVGTAAPAAPGSGPAAPVPAPDLELDGFPVWLGADHRPDRLVVLVEGFDLRNELTARDLVRLAGPAASILRAQGWDLIVVDFPDSHPAPDTLAPLVARAIRAGAAAAGRPVSVVGLSAGGLAARWALAEAEGAGAPLPARLLVTVDTPHRGARLHPAIQALSARYGDRGDREALACPAARSLLDLRPAGVRWRKVGLPGFRRRVPREWRDDPSAHQEFFARLRALPGGGYPRQCRVAAVATGSRGGSLPAADLLRLWVPFTFGWTLPVAAEDRVPGSLLPDLLVRRLERRIPLGLGGVILRSRPTFVSTASALDAAPGETPPFAAWYARPDGQPPLPHDTLDPGAAPFLMRELLR